MEKTRKLSIKDESEQEVRQIEKELDDHPELDNIQVTKEMDDALFAKIRELEEKEYRKEKQENTGIWFWRQYLCWCLLLEVSVLAASLIGKNCWM